MEKWTDEQMEWMLDADNEFYFYGTVTLRAVTGKSLRELLQMRWEDIDSDIEKKLSKYYLIHRLDQRHGLIFKKSDGTPYTAKEFANEFNTYCINRNLNIRIEP